MVVTDLHGDWPLYQRYRDVFLHLRAHDLADTLLLTGDYIHSYGPPEYDGSLEIGLDLLGLHRELGPNLVVLLGNHEMPHIYPYILSRGDKTDTAGFEHSMGRQRDAIITFFDQHPFFVRTRAGVSICHAGAFPQAVQAHSMKQLRAFSHQALLDKGRRIPRARLAAVCEALQHTLDAPYDRVVRDYFAVPNSDDARYYDYIISQIARSDQRFDLLWDVMHNRNERDYGTTLYTGYVTALLRALSTDYAPQSTLITGHLTCNHGYHVLANDAQLRIASGEHARPHHEARYVLFDAGRVVPNAHALVAGLGCIFDE